MGARGAELRRLQLQFWDSTLKSDRGAQDALKREADASKPTDPVWLRMR
jgi:hypothetical protein